MLLAKLSAAFQWGVLLVTDASSSEQIPDWSSSDERVTAAGSALVVRARPYVEDNVGSTSSRRLVTGARDHGSHDGQVG